MDLRRDFLLAALIAAQAVVAQVPGWEAEVPAVHRAGLHAITLSPELLGVSRSDLGDIRLVDSTGADVPYVLREVWTAPGPERFVPFKLLRNEVVRSSTVIELERPEGVLLEQLAIRIRPVQVQKQVRITGSDDRSAWYMVKDDHLVIHGTRGDPPHQVLAINLPKSDYRYLRLTLNDSITAPVQVIDVGRYVGGSSLEARFVSASSTPFIQQDSGRTSTLHMRLEAPVLVERIALNVRDTVRYKRSGQVRSWRRVAVREKRRKTHRITQVDHGGFTISSGEVNAFSLPAIQLDTFALLIHNGDDRPLRFDQVRLEARHRILLAHLLPDMTYRLTTGAPDLRPPTYDMANFAEDLASPLDTLQHGMIRTVPAQATAGPIFDPTKVWVWGAILVLMALMAWMAFRLLRPSQEKVD